MQAVVIPEGQTTAEITINSIGDQIKESNETINIRLNQRQGYRVDTDRPNNVQQTVTIEDNEKAGILLKNAQGQPISSLQFSTQENSNTPLTFTAQLTSKPTDKVQLYFFSSNPGEGILTTTRNTTTITDSEIVLNFTPDNWNQPQSFSVVPQNDSVADGQVRYAITNRVRSQDPTYNDTNDYQGSLGITDRLIELGKANNQLSVSNPNSPKTEQKEKAFDNDSATKWLIFSKQAWLQVGFLDSAAVVNSYSLTSANDLPQRDPQNWELLGSNDGQNFEVLDQQSGVKFNNRFETKTFDFDNGKSYNYYRLNILTNSGANEIQLAEFNLHVKDQLVIANNDDNDTPGFTVTPLSSTTEGTGDAFSIKLNSQPVGKVVVTMTPGNEEFYFLSKNPGDTHSITFDPQNWNTPQTIQITAVDDNKVEYLQKSDIKFQVSGEDPKYNSLSTTVNSFLQFDGIDDYIKVDRESDFDFTDVITVEAWIKVDQFNKNWQSIVTKGDSSWRLARNNNTNSLEFAIGGGNTTNVVGGITNVNDGKLHHVAGVYDGAALSLYIDGQLDNQVQVSRTLPTNNYDVLIGENAEATGRQFAGQISEVRIWNAARTQEQIQANMNKNKSLVGNEPGLKLYYNSASQQATPNQIFDSSGNNHNGVFQNGVQWKTTNDIFFKPLEVIIKDNDVPTAKITPGKAAAEIYSTPGYFIIELDRDPNNLPPNNTGIEVNYRIVGGTATLNADYQSINTSKVRVFGNQVLLPIVPIDDKRIEDLTFTINKVTPGTTNNGKTTLTLDVSAKGVVASDNILITASSLSSPNGEQKESAADKNSQTKWLISNNSGWIQYEFVNNPTLVSKYYITSANDFSGRDPVDWTLQGSNDGQNFVPLDTRANIKFANRFEQQAFTVNNPQPYRYYRLNVTKNNGGIELQLADFTLEQKNIIDVPTASIVELAGQKTGSVKTPGRIDQFGQGWFSFDGNNDYVSLPSLTMGGDFTVEAWVRVNQHPQSNTGNVRARIIDFGNGAVNNNIILNFDGTTGRLRLETYNGSNYTEVTSDSQIPTGEWIHVAGVNDGKGNASLYINGELVKSEAGQNIAQNISRSKNFIAQSNWSNEKYFNGDIAELRVWDTVRSHQQIKENINRFLTDKETDLKVYFSANTSNFNQPGTTTQIQGINGINGTLQNGAIWTVTTVNNPIDNNVLNYKGQIQVEVDSSIANQITANSIARFPSETVTVELLPGDGYKLGDSKSSSLNIIDNDVPGIRIVTGGNRAVAIEDDPFKTNDKDEIRYSQYELSLLSEPSAPVTLTLTSNTISNTPNGAKKQLRFIDASDPQKPKPVDSITLTFQPENWYQMQTVNVQAIDDGILENDTDPSKPHEAGIQYQVTSRDPNYNNLPVADQIVGLVDRVLDKTQTNEGIKAGLDTLRSTINNLELPIIGSLEGRSPTLMADLGNLVSKQINQLEPDQLTSTQLDNFLEKALTELGIPGVNVTTKMTDTDVYFAFDLNKEYNLFKLDLSSDLGVPALGIGFETQGQLTGNFKYDIGLGFGINKLLGFYLDPDKTKFSADVSLNLGDFKGKGNLGFLQVDFADDPKNPTKLGVSFNVKLKDPQAGKNNLKKVSPPVTTINVAASPVETTPADQITIPQTQSLPSVPTEKAAIQPLTDSQPVLPKEPSTTVPGKNIKQIPLADKTLTGIVAEKTVQYNQNLSAILATAPLTSTFTNISAQTIRSWLGKPDTDVSVISQQVINALKNAAPAVKVALQTLLKDAGQIDIGLNDKQLQITYLGTIDVTQLKTVVPGVKDLPLDGLKLPVTKPRLTITNPGLENANYTFAADSLPTAELVTWLANKGKTLLPAEVQTVLNELLKLGQNLDVVFASDQIQVTYQGSLDIAQLRGVIPGIKDLPLNGLTLPVEKPSITITDPGSKSANYTFTAASLPKAQLVNWLSNQAKTLLPTQVQEVLNKLLALTQNVDLVLGKEQIQITAKGDLDIATVIREIPGVKELPLNDLSLPVKNPSITITNPQSKNASYIFVAESLPKQQLANWVTQKATTLLPTEVQDVLNKLLALTNTVDLVLGKNQIEVAYKGNLNLATLIKEIPGVKDLPLGGLTLDVTNPRLTITNPTSANPDYAFAVDSLPKRQIINWLGNQGKSLLPQEVQTILNQLLTSELERVDLVLGKKQMQITYKGDLQLDSFIKFIPGLSDLPLDGLNLPVTNPSLTLVNLEQGVNNIDYVFSVDRLPKDELTKWLREKAVSLLPQEVRNVLDNLLQVAENVDLKLGKNQIQVAYLGNLELGAILKQIPGIQDLPLDTLKLPVTNPKLTIINPNSQDIDYSFVADNLPKQELIDWLVQQLPDNVKSILNTVSNAAQQVDVLFSDRQLQLGYKGNIDLAKIVKVIPGIQELPNLDSLALPVANPRLTLSNLGTKNLKNIDYTFSSDSLPKAELVNWVKTTLLQQLPADVQSFLQKALDIVKNIDLKFGNNQIQIGYLGDLNLKTIIDQIGTQLGDFLSPLKGLNLTLTNPSITITNPKQTPSLSFGVDNLPMNQVKTWLTEQVKTYVSDASVQNFLTGLLNEIAQIDLVVGDTQTQITYLGTVDLAKALKTIPGLESFTPNNLTLPILNPSFTVTRTGKTRTFSLSAESLPKQELTEWLGTEIKNQLPAEVRSIVDSLLAVADKMDVQLGSNQVQFNYQGALDLATIIKEIPGLKELPVNNLQLPVLNPRLAITNPGKNASYSFAADELPKTQLVTWIKQQLPTDVQSVLDTITAQAQQLDVVVGNNQIQLTYNGAVDLVKVLGLIPGVKELLPATTQPLNIINPSLTILNPGKNASFSFAADKLPKQELLDLISSQIPTEVKSVFNNLSENLDVIFGQGIIQVNYRGDVDLMKIASLIPGVKELPLNGLKLNVTNPSFTLINKGKAAGATLATFDYVFAADKLPTQDLINWAKNTTTDILPAEVKGVLDKLLNIAKDVNFTLGNGQMQIAYNGNLDIAQVIGLIPGLQDVSVFKGLNLPVTNPSITIINPKPGTGLKTQYLLKSDRLPKEELAKWAKEKATALLPADVAKILGSLSAIAQGINLEIGTNQIQLSYEGTVDLSSILKEIPSVNQLPLDKLKLPVLNPSLTITNPGKNASYSFAAAQLPKEQLINWLKDQAKALIPSELLSIFNTLANIGQNLDVRFGDSQLQVMYQGNLNLVDILKSIPGLSSFNVSDLTLNVQNPSITILNPGRNADFSFKADKLPVDQLKDWLTKKVVNLLPEVATNIIKDITGVLDDVNVIIDKNDIQILYNGSLDLSNILQKIPGLKNVSLPPANTLLVTNPAITLTKGTDSSIDFNFTAEKLSKDGLKKWLIDTAQNTFPTSVRDLVAALIDTAADFDVLFKNNKLQISYAGTLDAAKVIQKIPGLSELQTTGLALPITNPILTIYDLDKGISKANYTFAADHLPKEELINWLTKQATSQLPQSVLNVVDDLLELARRIDLQLGKNTVQITYQGVLDLADVLRKIPGINNLSFNGLDLPITNPSVTITKPEVTASGTPGTWKDASFSFKADKLPTEQLANWLTNKAGSILPTTISKPVEEILTAFGPVNLSLSNDKFQFSADTIKLEQVINAIPGLNSIFTTIPELTLKNTSLTLSNFGQGTTQYQFASSEVELNTLATALGLPSNISTYLPTVNLFVGSDRLLFSAPQSLDLKTIVPINSLGLPEIITKYIPDIKLDNAQLSITKTGTSGKEINLSGTISGLELGLTYSNGKWTFKGIDDGGRLSALDLIDLLKQGKGKAKQGFFDLVEYQLTGGANLGLTTKTSIEGNPAFPAFSFDLAANFPVFNYGNQQEASKTGANIKLNNIAIDLGSFISNLIGPIIKEVNEIIEPLKPVIQLLNSDTKLFTTLRLSGFDDNRDGKVTLLEIAKKLAPADQKAKIEKSQKFIKAVGDIVELITELSKMPANQPIIIDLGSYTLSGFKAASKDAKDAANKVETNNNGNTSALQTTNSTIDPIKQAEQKSSGKPASGFLSKLKNIEGLQFPVLTNPMKAIDLLLGKTTDLVIYDVPDLDFNFAMSKNFPIWGPIAGQLSGEFSAKTNLLVGFDSYGVNQWKDKRFAFKDIYRIFDGFYVGDWNAQGQDIDELVLNATIAAGLGLDIGFASAFMRGGIQGKVGLDFNDVGENNGTSDGKIRGSEIISRINNPLQLFDLNGNIDAFLDAKVSVAIVGTVWQKEFARFNLAKFSLGASGFSASGALSQSYIAGATIFFDVNFNNQWDEEEIKSITDEYGQFNLDLPVELDKNNNGQIDINEGQLLGLGGFDTSSGLPSGALIALPGATIITPLTSLQAKLVQGGLDRDEANTLVKQQLGLDLAVNLETFDPLKAVGENSANGLKVYLTHVQIQALLNQGRALLDGLQTATPEGQANPNNLLDAIAGLAKFLQQRSAQTQTGLDFTKETDLKPFFSFLITERNLTATEQQLDTVAQIVVQGNEYLSQIAQIATKRTLAEVLPAIASMKRLVQSDSTKLVTELAQGKKTSAEVEQEFETTLKKSNTFVDADIAAFGNRRIRVVTVNKEIAENSTNSVEFTIELNQPAPNQGLTVFYSLTGTATLNQDYKLDVSTDTIGELYIAPGQSTATIKVTAVNDTIDEPLETIAIRLKSVGEGYTIDPTGTVGLIEIQDDDQDVVNNPVTGIVKLGTFADDTLTGATGNDRLEGDYGDDNLDGKEGNDILRGGENNDTLTGGAGDDVLEGNYGDDNLNGGDGNDLLEGSIGEDTLKGGAGIDILKGGVDNDILEGNAGNDQIEGQSGNDILVGNEDNDWLVGGEGHDVLIGGLGDDILNGGQGADVFFLNSANDGFDTLLDFNPSQGDKIQISASGFGVDNLNDFTFLSGILDFQGKNLALIQNNGATYSFFPNLSEIIQIVDAPQAIPEVTPQVKAATEPLKTINTGVTAANSIPESTDTSNKSLLDKVLERGYITFGTSNSYATTLGFDLEFVKAIAVALFGDESKIKLVTTSFDDGFTQVANQTLDLTARRVSQNLDRDTERNVDFGPVYLYDYQAILVKADSNIENASDLKGKGLTIGVVSATNALGNLQNLLTPQGINFTPKEFKTTDELFAAYHNGEIAAISTDRALIYNRLGDAIAQNRILDVEFSQEPISLVLPENESEWADVVRWVTYATIQAEEFGITSENIGQIIAENTDTDTKNDASPAIRRFLGLQDELGKALNIRNDFVVQIIKQVGNYGEIYDRHFSNLERDLNLLWTDDGLMYSPPFSGVTQDIQLINNDQRNLLAEIQQRGVLKFGIPEGSTFPGFAEKNNDGTYQGFDIDLGRAIAVAVFGDASKIEFVSQQFNDGFANTANGKVDVSAAAYTHNLMRDASLGIDYSPIYLYTEQGILTRVDSDITALPLLNGRAVGVVAGTTALQNLEDALKVFDVKINPVIYSSSSEMYAAYDSKQVDAVFNDVSLLAGRISSLPHPEEHRIIRDNFTKEPLALIVDENQSDWADVVRWVTNALKQAEQYGITSKNIDQFIADNTDNLKENNSSIEIQAFLGLRGNIGTSLGLPNDFVVKMIKEVGNYSEIYARNFNTDLLPRQKNELSKELGLQTTAPLGINTNNLNSMPIAEDDNAQTTTNTAVNIDVLNNDKDLDNNPLTLSIVSTPSHGQVQINDNGTPNDKTDDFIIYTANSNFTGIDKFTYQVNDGKGGTDSASVNVSVKSAVVFNNQNNVLKLQGQLNNQKLKFSLNSKHLEKQVIHEVAFVAYDNEQGAVNGLLPGQNGYLNALLQRAEIIFSVIPDNFIADPTKIIDGFQSQYLGAVLLQDTSLDAVKADSSLLNRVLLGSPFNSSSSEILDINELAAGKLQLSFQDQLGDAQKDLVLTVETTNEPVPLGADLQRQSGMEVVDLRDFNGKEIQALFPVVASEAAYDNTIGFYQVEDTQGTVKDGLTGTLFRPGDAGYDQAAIRNSQLYGVIMNNHGAGTQGVFAGGKIYAPYLIANGTVDGALGNTGVPVYFAFLGANPDKKDHVLSLGDNMWGFEDLPNGGDLDFNDIVVQAKFSVI